MFPRNYNSKCSEEEQSPLQYGFQHQLLLEPAIPFPEFAFWEEFRVQQCHCAKPRIFLSFPHTLSIFLPTETVYHRPSSLQMLLLLHPQVNSIHFFSIVICSFQWGNSYFVFLKFSCYVQEIADYGLYSLFFLIFQMGFSLFFFFFSMNGFTLFACERTNSAGNVII